MTHAAAALAPIDFLIQGYLGERKQCTASVVKKAPIVAVFSVDERNANGPYSLLGGQPHRRYAQPEAKGAGGGVLRVIQ